MAKQTTPGVTPVAMAFALYHLVTIVIDAETCMNNLRAYQARQSGANLARLLLAEGVLIKDLGLGA
ncbi:hypothetical protein [Streptacidiphilus jiangxiensis]|uniref:Uncharacterized protein n=1 Tax=Streptacidiphilus jiangxiensis TaxID=235985 RepID=A0A1H7WL64_STRJI|nr:hypothetical protein [Streptacidiphilus jiangxiensis]SEM21637.1 hypothetical protein SAMN05414137_120206 [Streptacidiphilus jiangxiensis]